MESNRSYRIRTKINSDELQPVAKIDLPLTQTYDMFEILSLKLNQKNDYNFYDSEVGLVVGRVLANQGFGIPNAKVSVFIPMSDDATVNQRILYNFVSTQDSNYDNIRYNLLPDFVDNACHQDVGTFPNKRLVLDNNDVIEIFDKYYKYTTVTNEAGDYMIYGVPTGSQTIHVDLDMSDIGVLSQRPRDMVYKGYNINQFESPNKFKTSTNLNSLSQLYSQDKGVFVYSYWGNSNNGTDHIAITRCDINIEYKFEPTCIFIGSIVTDKGSNAIGKNCTGTDNVGKMSDLMAGEGSIEMIRKTIDGKVEECPIKGNRLIDGDGVWCYQIPMNLDYVMTDEYGNIVPTDDPSKGIPTRTRVRFRISLDESPMDATARKRCRFLVPNNPRMDETYFPEFCKVKEADYEFGSMTREESYCDMLWNNVYTVKSYIPRLQKNKNTTNRKHTGIKLINHFGDNNPMPYNNLSIKMSFTYRFICVLMKIVIWLIATINQILGFIMEPICVIAKTFLNLAKIFCKTLCIKIPLLGRICPLCPIGTIFRTIGNLFYAMVVKGITLSSDFCDDGINKIAFYPTLTKIAQCVLNKVKEDYVKKQNSNNPEERARLKVITITSMNNNELVTCIENQLAQENDATSFNFQNDWLNGCLYAPLWYRKITPKKRFLFGLFKKKAKDQWCRADSNFNLMVYQPCALKLNMGTETVADIDTSQNVPITKPISIKSNCGKKCHEEKTTVNVTKGLVLTKENMLGQTLYYYKAINYEQTLANANNNDGVVLLFATDIVLLGSLNDCDINGIPQFFKYLESTTYNLPTDILFTDTIIQVDSEGKVVVNGSNDIVYEQFTEATGCDWGNLNSFDECGKMGKDTDSGLFYGIGCSSIELEKKSCLNLSRICEYGVSLDDAKDITLLETVEGNVDSTPDTEKLTPDGFISFDELYNINERSMFATLNGNRLHTRLNNKTGLKEYDLKFLYVDNFDGLMQDLMRKSGTTCNYTKNYKLEYFSRDYYLFRMGNKPFYYDSDNSLPRYENSFYFYFGIKAGKTAIEKFNSQFFATCENALEAESTIKYKAQPNDWCATDSGYILLDMSNIAKPYDIILNSVSDGGFSITVNEVNEDNIYFGNKTAYTKHNNKDIPTGTKLVEYTIEDADGNETTATDLPNGKYEITITDGEGNISTSQINLSKQPLSFTYSKVDNDIPNNQREDENGGNYLNESYLSKIYSKYEEYGGYITIDSIMNGENPNGKYRVTVKTYKNLAELPNYSPNPVKDANPQWPTCEIRVNEQGSITGYSNAQNRYAFKYDKSKFYIIVPKGDVDYVVSITDISNPNCEKNYSSLTIRIADALPFKLFVNDVDISALKDLNGDNWRIGYENNNPKKAPEITSLGKAWTNLSNEGYYDITKLDEYDEIIELEDEFKEIEKERNELIEVNKYTVKNGKVTIEYVVKNGKVTIEYVVKNDKVTIDYVVKNDKVTINDKEYPAVEGKVTIGGVEYPVVEGKVTIEYVVKNGEVTINGNTYTVKDGKVTIDSIEIDKKNEEIKEKKEEIKEKKEEITKNFIASVKDAFWITNAYNPKEFIITVQTNKYPIKYYLFYNEEESSEIAGVNQLTDDNKNTYLYDSDGNTAQITDILIPTITNKDNAVYGYGNGRNSDKVVKDNISYGYDRTEGHGFDSKGKHRSKLEYIKKPYGIRIVNKDGNGEKLPIIGNVNVKMGDKDERDETYFFFHFVDKILRFNNMLAWSYINNIPYPPTNNENYMGKFINMNGLCTGIIYNGIPKEVSQFTTPSVKYQFETFTLGGIKNILVNTTNSEDDIPTIRYLCKVNKTENGEEISTASPYEYREGFVTYKKYGRNYIAVRNRQDVLEINDSGNAFISETIYGNMKISLSAIEKDGDKKITFKLDNDDNEGNNKFYLFIEDNKTDKSISTVYPLRYAQLTEITDKNNKNISLWTFNGESYGIMGYDIPIEALYECATKDVKGYTPTDEKEDETDEKAYSTTGVFKYSDKLKNKRFYVVAVTSNNCRTISPLYDYRGKIGVSIFMAEFETIVKETESSYNYVISNKLGIRIIVPQNTSDEAYSYYIDKYPSNVSLLLDIAEGVSIDEDVETDENKIAYFDINTGMASVLSQLLSNDIYFNMYKKKFNITVTDVTNLPIEVDNKKREGNSLQNYYSVVWQLDENDIELPDNFDLDKTFYLKKGEKIINIIKNNNLTVKQKNGYYSSLIKINVKGEIETLPDELSWTMPSESIIITTRYTPTQFIFKIGEHGIWNNGDVGYKEGKVEIIDDENIKVTIDSTITPVDGWKFTGWLYDGQTYDTLPIIFNEPIYLAEVKLEAQYESV